MPRPKSPCGTYAAYQRHLKERTAVDPACRRAQQEHAGRRSLAHQRRDVERPPAAVALPVRAIDQLRMEIEAKRDMFGKSILDLAEFTDDGNLYGVADLMNEMDELLEEWCTLQAAVHAELGEDVPGWLPDVIEDLQQRDSAAEV